VRQAQQRAGPASVLARQAIDAALLADDDLALARAYLVSDWANRILGVMDAESHGERALALYERIGYLDDVAKAANNLGGISYFEGRWDDALRWYRQALDACQRAGNDAAGAVTASNLGELLVSMGAFDEAEPLLRDAIRVFRASRDLTSVIFPEIQLGRLMLERGDTERALEQLAPARDEASALGQYGHLTEASIHLASALAALGRPDSAFETLDRALVELGTVDPVFEPTWARATAQALAASGRIEEARNEIERGVASAREQGLVYEEGLLLLAGVELDRLQGIAPERTSLDEIDVIFRRLNVDRSRLDAVVDQAALVAR
jgi:tetratricopeptide (TPR) repeat protein